MTHQPQTSDGIYLDLSQRLPSWVFRSLTCRLAPVQSPIAAEGLGVMAGEILAADPAEGARESIAKDPVYGMFCDMYAAHYAWLTATLAQCSIEQATGEWLDLHAAARGYSRLAAEADYTLRARIRSAPQVATHAAIRAAVNDLIISPSRILAIDAAARTIDLGEGPISVAMDAVCSEGDNTMIRLDDLSVGDHVEIADQLPNGDSVQWVRRIAYVFTLAERGLFWGDSWNQRVWGRPVLPTAPGGSVPSPNARNVAVIAIPPQIVALATFWGQFFWGHDSWGGVWEDADRYANIHARANAVAAAGVKTLLWIQEE